MNIFISDDSAALRERLCAALSENAGLNVIGQAGTVPATLDGVKALQPDVLIQDIFLHQENGLRIIEDVKRTLPKTVVIVFARHPEHQYRRLSLEAGADHYLVKSSGWNALLTLLQRIVTHDRKARSPSLAPHQAPPIAL